MKSLIRALIEDVEHFQKRVIQDALAQATASFWCRRAEAFEAAMPRPGDFTGNASAEELEEQRLRLTAEARACRRRARAALIGGER